MKLIICIVLVTLFAIPVLAAQQCAPHSIMVEKLPKAFGEVRTHTAMAGQNSTLFAELFVSPNGSWTLLITHPTGISCIQAAGQNWEALPLESEKL